MTDDNTLKYLVEQYPEQFASWLLAYTPAEVQILKTELTLEPIRADAVIFLQIPIAVLARAESPERLLQSVAAQVGRIEAREQQLSVSACVQILAGLKFNNNLIHQFFREEVMQESTIYQEIIQKGIQQGIQQARESEVALIWRQLNRKIGEINPDLQAKIQDLPFAKLEELGEALLDFSVEADLANWLAKN